MAAPKGFAGPWFLMSANQQVDSGTECVSLTVSRGNICDRASLDFDIGAAPLTPLLASENLFEQHGNKGQSSIRAETPVGAQKAQWIRTGSLGKVRELSKCG